MGNIRRMFMYASGKFERGPGVFDCISPTQSGAVYIGPKKKSCV